MPGRSADVRKTPLGHSLAELGGRRMTRHLWKELERIAPTAALHGRAQQLLAGWSGDGYTAVWALTISELVTLTEQSGASRVVPLGDIAGVVRPADGTIRVLIEGGRSPAFRSPDAGADAFARAVADRAHAPLGGVDALFSADGLVALTGIPARVSGYYLGGFRDLTAGLMVVLFDDHGVHLAPAATPWWQVCALPWADVREIRVEGREETRQRVTATRILIAGRLARAIPKDEEFSHAYVTVAATDDDLVVRIDRARPLELKIELADVLRRPAAEPERGQSGAGGGADLAGQVARLGELHQSGVLTAEEFAAAKRKLLGL